MIASRIPVATIPLPPDFFPMVIKLARAGYGDKTGKPSRIAPPGSSSQDPELDARW